MIAQKVFKIGCSETAVEAILRQELSAQRVLAHVFGCILFMHECLPCHNF